MEANGRNVKRGRKKENKSKKARKGAKTEGRVRGLRRDRSSRKPERKGGKRKYHINNGKRGTASDINIVKVII